MKPKSWLVWRSHLAPALLQSLSATARTVPDNVQSFYNSVQDAGPCTGSDPLKGGFYDTDDSPADYGYCQKGVAGNAVYLKGPGTQLANMDVDCDGEQTGLDPRCQASTDTQSQTAFQSQLSQYGISDLNAGIVPYVVLGNQGNYSPTFDPQTVGILPLSVVAVVCGDQLIYGIWGDTNGDDGKPLVGEASLALATACYGQNITGNNGHDAPDVLYVAFVGQAAVPGAMADWNASNYQDFEASIESLGDKLVSTLPAFVNFTNSTNSTNSTGDTQNEGSRCTSAISVLQAMALVLGFSFL